MYIYLFLILHDTKNKSYREITIFSTEVSVGNNCIERLKQDDPVEYLGIFMYISVSG